MSRKLFFLAVFCVLIVPLCAETADLTRRLEQLYSSNKPYAVKKHIRLALSYAEKNMVKSLRRELDVLRRIDRLSKDEYAGLLESIEGLNKPEPAYQQKNIKKNISKNITGSRTKFNAAVGEKFEKACENYRKSRIERALRYLYAVIELDEDNEEAEKFIREIKSEKFVIDNNKPFQNIVKDLYEKGMRFYRKEMYVEAGGKFKEALETDPSCGRVKEMRAKVSEKLGAVRKREEKKNKLKRAEKMRINGDVAGARRIYAVVLSMDPENKKAGFYLRKFDNKSAALVEKARKNYLKGSVEEAYENVSAAIGYNSENKEAVKLNEKIEAELKKRRGRAENKRRADILYNKGVVSFSKGDYAAALSYWEETLRLTPEDIEAKKNIKLAKEKLSISETEKIGKMKRAFKEAEELFQLGLFEKAKGKYDYVLRLDPANEKARKKILKIKNITGKKGGKSIKKR